MTDIHSMIDYLADEEVPPVSVDEGKMRELQALPDVQSVGTAPKNGVAVLVWDGIRWAIASFEIRYPGDKGRWVNDSGGSWSYDDEITHWAPLPRSILPEEKGTET